MNRKDVELWVEIPVKPENVFPDLLLMLIEDNDISERRRGDDERTIEVA